MDNVIGGTLRQARSDQGMSLRQLARAVHFSPGYLSKVENGTKLPSVELAAACDRILGITPPIADLARELPRRRRPVAHPDAAVPAQLPHAPSGFLGRRAELESLTELAAGGAPGPTLRCGVLTGAADAGKTSLAVYFGHLNTAAYPDGQLFVDLRGSTGDPLGPEAALGRLLRGLGVGASDIPDEADELLATYRSLLARRRALVVLDDAADAEQVRPLLPGGGASAVLVTSRDRLTDLVVREGASELPVGRLGDDVTREALHTGLGTARVAAEPAATSSLVAALDGRPLSIRTALARLRDDPALTITAYLATLPAGGTPDAAPLQPRVCRSAELRPQPA